MYKLVYILVKNNRTAFLSGLFYIILPIISYRLFYLNATFYANFVGMTFLLLFQLYLYKYREQQKKAYVFTAMLFYAATLFTHQLVFMMATILLGLDFLTEVIFTRKLLQQIIEKALFIFIAIILNIGYILKTPIVEKVLHILGLVKTSEFGNEVTAKGGADLLPPIVPEFILGFSLIAIVLIFYCKQKKLYPIAIFHGFLISPIILNAINIHLPASFRYDSFYIITIPILISIFLSTIKKPYITFLSTVFLISIFVIQTAHITNGFSLSELGSLQKGLSILQCKNTVSYFRIAPWIPVLSDSTIYYAHVDIYNAHQDKMNEAMSMFLTNDSLKKRLSLMKQHRVNCMVYEKKIVIVDGIRVKGWEQWRYKDLYAVSTKVYEDKNITMFKIPN
jgi:hypothetical protein